jgi:hypothetical protein
MDINDIKLDDETDALITAAITEKNKKAAKAGKTKKRREPFIIIAETQFELLSRVANSTTMVLLHLMFRDFAARGKPFVLSGEALFGIGVDRYAKQRALDRLEKLGWVSVERKPGKEPRITIIRPTKTGE